MSGWLRVEANGALSVDEAASLQLGRNPGGFQLARTAPDLLLAVRQPDGEVRSPVGRIAFAGDLDGLPFPDVVMMLAQGRRSGLLHVRAGPAERLLVFAGGEMTAASSNQPGERLGEVALRLGLLERTDLAALLSSPAAGRRVGQRLVERGLVDRERLVAAVREQIGVVFEAILVRQVGTFYFRDHPVPPDDGAAHVEAQGLLLDGLRRLDEWAHYRSRIPSTQALVRLGEVQVGLPEEVEPVLELLRRGPATVGELAARLRLPEVEAMRRLFALAEAGAIQVSQERDPRPLAALGADPAPLQELLHAFNRIFGEIFTEVALADESADFVQASSACLAQEDCQRLFRGLSFDADGNLPADEILRRLPEAAQHAGKGPRSLLLEALQPVFLHLLELASDRLDPAAREDLHARLRLLFGMSEW